ncbi:nuclear transport factor 2 [Sporothrix brasiliensis 5110]|uniref:Nuclear transport factor 2 n=1 Tax=Sporothrix brasiliensis 5110 TaxID=1398154 RepID=A0A0C2IRF0_9PEZI|nr:nuclear transport factor 2 [Sporothrix brasiliensis 5110]KIH89465.1 nuclear transport factor 2 [Sporothrix brasiliensis 5110]
MANDFQNVAQQFVAFYYNTFDTDRTQLQSLYRDNSMLTFESSSVLGAAAIVEKLKRVKHVTSTLDPQPTVGDGVIVLVTGQLQVDDEERPMNFTQVFHLAKDGANYFVYNDVFKLIFG